MLYTACTYSFDYYPLYCGIFSQGTEPTKSRCYTTKNRNLLTVSDHNISFTTIATARQRIRSRSHPATGDKSADLPWYHPAYCDPDQLFFLVHEDYLKTFAVFITGRPLR